MGKWVTDACSVAWQKTQKFQVWRCGACGKQFVFPRSPLEADYHFCPVCGDPKNGEITYTETDEFKEWADSNPNFTKKGIPS